MSFDHQPKDEFFLSVSRHPKRHKQVIWKLDKSPLLVVGEGVALNEIVLTNALTLVDRFGGSNVSPDGVKKWVLSTSKDLVIYVPDVFVLPWGGWHLNFEQKRIRTLY